MTIAWLQISTGSSEWEKQMRSLPFVARRGLALLIMGLVLCESPTALAWRESQHRDHLTPMALDLVKLLHSSSYPGEIWETYRSYIAQGSRDEDFPCGISGIRATNHFYHALSGRGLTDSPWVGLGDPDVGTPAWALDNPDLAQAEEFNGGEDWAFKDWGWSVGDVGFGDMSWKRAIERYGYTDDSKRLAYYTLGFICHLLQDMGAPEHLHDDPHGASSFSGFEWWVWKNWDDLKPPALGDLRPRAFDTLEGFFTNLSLLGYSIDRFHGGDLIEGAQPIDPNSDLAKMFRVRYSGAGHEWFLENDNGKPILGFSSPGGGTNFLNRAFEWNRDDYVKSPIWTKGHDQGEWWPTSMEITGSTLNDEEGYYYIELSGDMPGPSEGLKFLADPGRNLYPSAFLPSPLPQVADQCAGWRTASVDGASLYSLIGSRMFPPVIEHTAGLIEHFFDIVNHPPYVRSLEVSQPGGYRYTVHWQDGKEPPSASITITDVAERRLTREDEGPTSESAEDEGLSPGTATVRIAFSEPVRSVAVNAGGLVLQGSLETGDTVWAGEMQVEPEGPLKETRVIAVSAMDKNDHYGNEGGTLDADPATPARRIADYPDYTWIRYESGEDRHYAVTIKREKIEMR